MHSNDITSREHAAGFDAMIALSRDLLDVGLRDLLAAALIGKGTSSSALDYDSIDPYTLIRLVYTVVNRQILDILTTLFRMVGKDLELKSNSLESEELHRFWYRFFQKTPEFVGIDHVGGLYQLISSNNSISSSSSSSAMMSFVDVVREPLYQPDIDETSDKSVDDNNSSESNIHSNADMLSFRKVISKQAITRGVAILKETPYAFTLTKSKIVGTSTINDRKVHSSIDSHSSLLTEHIYLATSLFQQRYHNPLKFRQLRENLSSGSLYRTRSQNKEQPRYDLHSFPHSTTFMMAMVCTLYCYLEEIYRHFSKDSFSLTEFMGFITDGNGVVSTVEADRKLTVVNNSVEIFQILLKLPTNTHAITQVVRENSPTYDGQSLSLSTTVIGYAVFLTASAINHSCSPNAVVKYCGDGVVSLSNLTKFKQPFRLNTEDLRKLELHIIVSNSAVRYGEEITISYGVLAGKDPFGMRQDVLYKQYLFRCHCIACSTEQQRIQEEEEYQHANQFVSESNISLTKSKEKVKDCCRKLNRYSSELETLNVVFTVLLSQSKQEVDAKKLLNFGEHYLEPFFRKMNDLRNVLPATLQIFWDTVETPVTIADTERLSSVDWEICKEYSQLYCSLLDMSAHLESTCGQFVSSAEKVALAIRLLIQSKLYVESDIVIARERVKLAGLLFNAGEIPDCHDVVRSAMDSLVIGTNDQDPDFIQAQQLLHFTSRLLPR